MLTHDIDTKAAGRRCGASAGSFPSCASDRFAT